MFIFFICLMFVSALLRVGEWRAAYDVIVRNAIDIGVSGWSNVVACHAKAGLIV